MLNGLSRDMVLTDDENGIIRQSSVNEAINQNASGLDYFRILAEQSNATDLTGGRIQGISCTSAPASIDVHHATVAHETLPVRCTIRMGRLPA